MEDKITLPDKIDSSDWTLEDQDKLINRIKDILFTQSRTDNRIKELVNGENKYTPKLNKYTIKDRRRIVKLALKQARDSFADELNLSPDILVGKILSIGDMAINTVDKDGNSNPDYRTALAAFEKISKIMGYDAPQKQELTVHTLEINLE